MRVMLKKIFCLLLATILWACQNTPTFRWVETDNHFFVWTHQTAPLHWQGDYLEGPHQEKIIHGPGTLQTGSKTQPVTAYYGTLNHEGLNPNHFVGAEQDKQLTGFGVQLRKNQEVRIGNFNQGEAAGELFIYHHDKPYYKGSLDKKGNGKGILFHADGSRSEGLWKNGKLTQGTIFQTDGSYQRGTFTKKKDLLQLNGYAEAAQGNNVYQGLWKKNVWNGVGILVSNDIQFAGNWKNGKLNGVGTALSDTLFYEGNWKNNQLDGFGQMLVKESFSYLGNFENNLPHGYGEIMYAQGDAYFGDWEKGMRQGEGRYIFGASAVYYNGQWNNNQPDGKGFLMAPTYIYQGEWKQGQAEGTGTVIYTNGDVYKGSLAQGKRHGQGIYRYANGMEYEGNFENDLFEGQGKLRFSQHAQLEGNFHQGLPKGPGSFSFSDPVNNVSATITGNWDGFKIPEEKTVTFADETFSFNPNGTITAKRKNLPNVIVSLNDWYKKHHRAWTLIEGVLEAGLALAIATGVTVSAPVSLPVILTGVILVDVAVQISSALVDTHETEWDTASKRHLVLIGANGIRRVVFSPVAAKYIKHLIPSLNTEKNHVTEKLWDTAKDIQHKYHILDIAPLFRPLNNKLLDKWLFSPTVTLEETFKGVQKPVYFKQIFGQPLVPQPLEKLQNSLAHFDLIKSEYNRIYLTLPPQEVFKMLELNAAYDEFVQNNVQVDASYAQYKQQLDLVKYTLYTARLLYLQEHPDGLLKEIQDIITAYQENLEN